MHVVIMLLVMRSSSFFPFFSTCILCTLKTQVLLVHVVQRQLLSCVQFTAWHGIPASPSDGLVGGAEHYQPFYIFRSFMLVGGKP